MLSRLILLTALMLPSGSAGDSNIQGRLVVQAGHTNPTCATATALGSACIDGALETNGAIDVAGAATLTGAVTTGTTLVSTGNFTVGASKMVVTAASGNTTVAGTLVVTGTMNGPYGATRQLTTPLVLTAAMSGQLIAVASTSDAVTVITLPAASTAGLRYCFVADSVSGSNREIDVEPPAGSDLIIGTTNATGGTGIATTAGSGHGMKNTHATAVRGNGLCLQSDGTNTWYQTYIAGTWAGY